MQNILCESNAHLVPGRRAIHSPSYLHLHTPHPPRPRRDSSRARIVPPHRSRSSAQGSPEDGWRRGASVEGTAGRELTSRVTTLAMRCADAMRDEGGWGGWMVTWPSYRSTCRGICTARDNDGRNRASESDQQVDGLDTRRMGSSVSLGLSARDHERKTYRECSHLAVVTLESRMVTPTRFF